MFRPKLAHSAHSYKSFKSVTLQRNTITVKRRFTNTQSFLDTIVRFEFLDTSGQFKILHTSGRF